MSKTVELRRQGAWTKWENILQWKVNWTNIIEANFHRVHDALPSPANIHVWGKSDTPACPLCSGRGSLQHLLSSCPKSLAEGCYCWCHDQVVKEVAEGIGNLYVTYALHTLGFLLMSFMGYSHEMVFQQS